MEKPFFKKNPFRGSWGTNILWKIYGGSFTPGANDQIMQGAREKVENTFSSNLKTLKL